MPQIRDIDGHVWVVTELSEVDWAKPRVGWRELDDLRHATLVFRTLDGSSTCTLRHIAPLDWRARDEARLLEWLTMAVAVPTRFARADTHQR